MGESRKQEEEEGQNSSSTQLSGQVLRAGEPSRPGGLALSLPMKGPCQSSEGILCYVSCKVLMALISSPYFKLPGTAVMMLLIIMAAAFFPCPLCLQDLSLLGKTRAARWYTEHTAAAEGCQNFHGDRRGLQQRRMN